MRATWLPVVCAACVSATACSGDVLKARELPSADVAVANAAVAANNAFACDLYAAIGSGSAAPANFFLSPFSISTALAMVDAGAAGETDAQLRAALHETQDADATNAAYHALLASLDTGEGFGNYTLHTADRLFGQKGFAFLPAFLTTTSDDFGAPLEPVDFAGDAGGATDTIDQWVSDQTDGKIPMLFAPGALDPTTTLVAANAIDFKGSWDSQFSPATAGPFTRADQTMVSAQMMSDGTDEIAVAYVAGAGTIGSIPFRGRDLSFVVVLPDESDGLPAVEAQLTGSNLDAWLAAVRAPNAQPAMIGQSAVVLPKFGITSQLDLASILEGLGVVDAFEPSVADFSATDGARDLYLAHVQHDAVVTVDEQGAEAVAATAASEEDQAVMEPVPFTADHPFIFLIHDEVTNAVLFMGRLGDPTQE
jgi:serpin B